MKFQDALKIQQRVHDRCVLELMGPVILLVEHPNVLTLGKNASVDFITGTKSQIDSLGADVIRIDRGGEVTAHMPGQLVAYPIIKLSSRQLGPKAYVEGLESSVIALLRRYNIAGNTDPINSGVWVGREKICAIGIRVSKRVTLHGLALNVNNDLSLFKTIVPCGIQERSVTSMKCVAGEELNLQALKQEFVDCFSQVFGYDSVAEISLAELDKSSL
jgi:lipoate-protein ligase B